MRLTIPVGSAQGALNRGIPQLGNFSTEEFLGSGVPGHPRVVFVCLFVSHAAMNMAVRCTLCESAEAPDGLASEPACTCCKRSCSHCSMILEGTPILASEDLRRAQRVQEGTHHGGHTSHKHPQDTACPNLTTHTMGIPAECHRNRISSQGHTILDTGHTTLAILSVHSLLPPHTSMI